MERKCPSCGKSDPDTTQVLLKGVDGGPAELVWACTSCDMDLQELYGADQIDAVDHNGVWTCLTVEDGGKVDSVWVQERELRAITFYVERCEMSGKPPKIKSYEEGPLGYLFEKKGSPLESLEEFMARKKEEGMLFFQGEIETS